MNIFLLGINHKTAPIELREKFSVTSSQYDDFNDFFGKDGAVFEQLVLSTCNRTEIYGVTEDLNTTTEHAVTTFSRFSQIAPEHFREKLYQKSGEEAVRHLFTVASGLDSMALGETEILGQVKDAYQKAQTSRRTRKTLNTLFQKSLNVGKKVRTDTEIGLGKISIASIAVDLSKKIFHKLDNKKVMLIGSGTVARQVCEALVSNGVKNIMIANRNAERAEALVEEFGGQVVLFDDLDPWMPQTDIVISSAGCPQAFIHKEQVERWMHHKNRKALFLIDLGVPRNISEDVNDVTDAYLYNLDDLKSIADQNIRGRQTAVQACEQIVWKSAEHFMNWFRQELTSRQSRQTEVLSGKEKQDAKA